MDCTADSYTPHALRSNASSFDLISTNHLQIILGIFDVDARCVQVLLYDAQSLCKSIGTSARFVNRRLYVRQDAKSEPSLMDSLNQRYEIASIEKK